MKKNNNNFNNVIGKQRVYEAVIMGKEFARTLMEEGSEAASNVVAGIGTGYFGAAVMAAAEMNICFGYPSEGSVMLNRTADLCYEIGKMSCFRRKFRFAGFYDWDDEAKNKTLWTFTLKF